MKKKLKNLFAVALVVMMFCSVPVSAAKKPYIKISSGTKVSVLAGKTKSIKAKTIRKKRKITYKSSKKSVATVTSKGKIRGKKYGTATIYVKARGMKTKKIKVSVKKPVKGLKLSSPGAIAFSAAGKTYQIRASVTPSSKYVMTKKLTYKSSFPNVASVSSSGKITTKNSGYTRITISTSSNAGKVYRKYMDVYVRIPVKSIRSGDSLSVKSWESKNLNASVSPTNAMNKRLNYKSSNTNVAVVSSEGVVTGIQSGTANITITSAENSKISKVVRVTVTSGQYQWPSQIKYTQRDGKSVITIDSSLKTVEILFKSNKGKIYSYTVKDVKGNLKELVETGVPFSYTKDGVTVSKKDKSNPRFVTFRIDETGETYDVIIKEWLGEMEFQQNLVPNGQQKVFFNVVK